MKITKHCLLLLAALPAMIIAHAQTADEIINKYVDAIGGKDKLSQIKSFTSSVLYRLWEMNRPVRSVLSTERI